MQKYFISCDWGTSSFRLRIAELLTCRVVHEVSSNQGIAAIYQAYRREAAENSLAEKERVAFYLRYLQEQLHILSNHSPIPLQGLPIIISGMASSSIGMQELPYAPLPFLLERGHTLTHTIPAHAGFPHEVLLISGLKSTHDVMRGEETQLIGLAASREITRAICLFPGTHSKHIYLDNSSITGFRTYMTGELFQTVATHTILQASLQPPTAEADSPEMMDAFRQGVQAGLDLGNILHALFTVRTGDLFKKRTRQENYYYLSGLLIGRELQDLTEQKEVPLYICSSSHLVKFYEAAASVLHLTDRTTVVPASLIDTIVIAGQRQIWQQTRYTSYS